MKKHRLLFAAAAIAVLTTMLLPTAGAGRLTPAVDAPALSVSKWVKGDPVKLEDGKGTSIYVVEFWATWCPPCRDSIPHLSELQDQYKDKDVVVIGVSSEDAETVESFVERYGDKMRYTVALDDQRATQKAFAKLVPSPGLPTAYVIDREGKLVWWGHPMAGLDEVVKELVSKPGAEPASESKSAETT